MLRVLHGSSMTVLWAPLGRLSERNQTARRNDRVSRVAVRPYTSVIDGVHRRDNYALGMRAGLGLIPLLSGIGKSVALVKAVFGCAGEWSTGGCRARGPSR
jgi:hypothetical protein